MTDTDDELLARLRAADPASALPPVDPARVAQLLEGTMSHDLLTESRETGTRDRGPLTWLVAAAAVVIIAGATAFAVLDRDEPGTPPAPTAGAEATVTELHAPAPRGGRCMVPNPQVLGRQPTAFDGTVEEVRDGQVTLAPSHWYAGEPTDLVTVDAPEDRFPALMSSVGFEEGERYLVAAAADGTVMVCGFSGTYDEQRARLYARAFGR